FCDFFNALGQEGGLDEIQTTIQKHAASMGLELTGGKKIKEVKSKPSKVITKKPLKRDKQIAYDSSALPGLEKGSSHAAHKVIESAMQVFAKDSRVFSVDSDLASTSG